MYVDGTEKVTTSLPYTAVCSLKPDTDYIFEVKARSVLGTGPSSKKKTFRTEKLSKYVPICKENNIVMSRMLTRFVYHLEILDFVDF